MADWWANAPPIAPAAPPAGGNWWDQAPPATSTPWADVGMQAIQNAPASALKFAKDIAQPVLHPIDTAKGLFNVGAGALDMANAATDAAIEPYLPKVMQSGLPEATFAERYKHGLTQQTGHEAYPKAVGKYFGDRYGSVEGFKKSVATDPVGVVGDVSSALMAGGGLAARAPGVVGKVGDIARGAGEAINPVVGPAKAVGALNDERARLTTPIKAPTTDELYEAAGDAYRAPEIKELVVKPSAVQRWKDETGIALNSDGINEMLAPMTFATLAKLDKSPNGAFFTGQEFDTLRKVLGNIARGGQGTERAAASRSISALDDFLSNVPKADVLRGDTTKVAATLSDARGNYAAAKRSGKIEKALYDADLNARRANSGMNVDNAIRQRIAPILKSEKLRRGFSDEEIAQMEAIVKGSKVQNLSRRLGNMLGGGGGLGALASGAAGGGLATAFSHNPATAVAGYFLAPAAGYAFKKLSGAMASADVNRLQELVRSRSPLGAQMQSSLGKFGQAATAARGSPTPKNIARLMLASRNLSTNLADAGITASPDDIAGSLGAQ
jgi:hypothetical protein